MEELLHYVWRHKIFPLSELRTVGGQVVEVIDPGLPNTNAGPDFFNAKVKIDDTLWVGNVELHTRSSEWVAHGHQKDRAYDNVVLHVVGEANCEVFRTDGQPVPQLLLPVPSYVRERYAELRTQEIAPRCYPIPGTLPKLTVNSWLSALQVERFEQKARLIKERLMRLNNHWEDAFFVTLARNFGFGINGDAFEAWASRLPLRAVDKHRDNLLQVEAFFFGTAGLLEEEEGDEHYLKMQKEYRYLSHKFSLPDPLPVERWRFLRLRPGNFPHVRLAQLAYLYHKQESLFSRVMDCETAAEAEKLFATKTSAYWETHFNFKKTSPPMPKKVGDRALNLILINTVVPFLYAYGLHRNNPALCERATRILESLKAESNHITRLWAGAGLHVVCAADSQALIQLQHEYCDKRDCLRCRFGYEYLRKKPE